jgi:hypothetical protein
MVVVFCLFFVIFFVHLTVILCRIGTKHEISVQKSHEKQPAGKKPFYCCQFHSTWKVIRQHDHDIMCVNNLVEDEDMLMDDTAQTLHKAATQTLVGMSVNGERASDVSSSPSKST